MSNLTLGFEPTTSMLPTLYGALIGLLIVGLVLVVLAAELLGMARRRERRHRAYERVILELGCGTGLLCEAYAARGHIVTGADPTPAMLQVARQKPHGSQIEWVQAFAQEFRSERRFDLIIMTGHAFQVMLSDEDVLATLTTMCRHLKPSGRAVFESRNPAIDWAEEWNGTSELTHTGVTIRETTEVFSRVGDRVTFEQRFQFPGETLVSFSELRFLPREAIEAQLTAAGLVVEALYGDWDCSPFDPAVSKEMIFVVQAARR